MILDSQIQTAKALLAKNYFTLTVIVTMSLAIAVFLSASTLANLLLLNPLPYPEQDRLVKVEHIFESPTGETNAYTYPGLIDLYEQDQFFEQSALVMFAQNVVTSLPEKSTLPLGYASPDFFSLLGAQTQLGRVFNDEEGLRKNVPVAVLSHNTWLNYFAGNSNVVGETVTIDATSFQIIGVLSKDFVEPEINEKGQHTAIWLAWDFNPSNNLQDIWYNIDEKLLFLGKAAPGFSISQLNESITNHLHSTWKAQVNGIAFFNEWSITAKVSDLKTVILGDNIHVIYLFIIGIYGLIFIACVNISNLFLMRTIEMQRPLAIRGALGATKQDLFKEMFNESRLLIFVATLVGLGLSFFIFDFLQSYLSTVLPRLQELSVNLFTLVLAVVSVFAFAFVFSKLSISIVNYKSLVSALQTSGKGAGIKISNKAQKSLVIIQVFSAVALIFFCLSVLNQVYKVSSMSLGFKSNDLYTLELSYAQGNWPDEDTTFSLVNQIQSTLDNLPNTAQVQRSSSPLDKRDIFVIKRADNDAQFAPEFSTVSADYFDMIQQQIIAGRVFNADDVNNRTPVVVVNEVFAREISADGDVIGMQLTPGGERRFTIIGVVKSMKFPGKPEALSRMYRSVPKTKAQLLIAFKPGQAMSKQAITEMVAQITPNVNVFEYHDLSEVQSELETPFEIVKYATLLLMVICAFLASVGLYGLHEYSSRLRSTEIATRMAVGATPSRILKELMSYNLTPILIAIGLSLVVCLPLHSVLAADMGWVTFVVGFVLSAAFVLVISVVAVLLSSKRFLTRPIIDSFNRT